jgi:protein-tyrosine phosphatase
MSINILFVCLGNICRSPAAEGIFSKLVENAQLSDKIKVDSCGTAAFNIGKPPDPRSTAAAARAGYDISQQIARQINDDDYHANHYLIAMDRINLTHVKAWAPKNFQGEIELFMAYSQKSGNTQVPDPFYDDEGQFDKVIKILEISALGLLEHVRKQHQL